MQFIKSIALPIVVVASLANAAPVSQEPQESLSNEKRLNAAGLGSAIFAGTAIYSGLKLNGYVKEAEEFKEAFGLDTLESRDVSEVEKRLGFGSKGNAAGALLFASAPALVGLSHWLATKEGQDFLTTDEGKDFASKLAVNDESLSKREPLNAAAMIGLTAGAVLKGVWGSKEAADEFLASEEGKEFVSKLATIESRDVSLESRDVSEAPEKRLTWGKAGAAGAAAVLGWFATKEGQDFLNTDEGKDFVSKLAVNDDSLSKREPLNAAAMIGLTAGAVLKGVWGSKEAADEFLASEEGKEFVSELATIESRDLSEVNEKRLSPPAWVKIGATLAAMGGAGFGGYKLTKEAEDVLTDVLSSSDLQARGKKVDYGYLTAAILAGFNAIRGRDVDDSTEMSARDNEKRLNPAAKWAAGAILSSFAAGSVIKNIATRDIDAEERAITESEIPALLNWISKEADVEARSADFDLLG